MAYQVPLIFHPTVHVSDLDAAARWLDTAFGRPAIRWNERWDFERINADYPLDYSFLFHMGDTIVDVFAPTLYRLPGMPVPPAPEQDGLVDVAWWTGDAHELMAHLDSHRIRATDQSGKPIIGGTVPESFLAPDSYLLWTEPADTGLAYEFMQLGAQHRDYYARIADPRLVGGAIPRPADDPLGVLTTSHHTILTSGRDRAENFFTRVFNGRILHQEHNQRLDADSTFVEFTDGIFEIAVPRNGSPYGTYLNHGRDHYLGITFQVADTDRVAAHFNTVGVPHEAGGGMVTTLPKSSLGVRWAFTAEPPLR